MKEEKIMYNSDKAAQRVTLSGWMGRDGVFWPDGRDPKISEHLARLGGCTHIVCECGNEHLKRYTMCDSCRAKNNDERYQAMPFKEWGGEPLCLYRDDTYFFCEDDLKYWAEEHEIEDISSIQLVICEPQYAKEIDGDNYYCDYLPEETSLKEVAPKLADALEGVNKVIRNEKEILCWVSGKFRTTIKEG